MIGAARIYVLHIRTEGICLTTTIFFGGGIEGQIRRRLIKLAGSTGIEQCASPRYGLIVALVADVPQWLPTPLPPQYIPGPYAVIGVSELDRYQCEYAAAAMRHGACDVINHDAGDTRLIEAVTTAQRYWSMHGARLIAAEHAAAKINRLTPRQYACIYASIYAGNSKTVAAQLDIAARTVEVLCAQGYARLGIRSRVEATKLFFEAGELSL